MPKFEKQVNEALAARLPAGQPQWKRHPQVLPKCRATRQEIDHAFCAAKMADFKGEIVRLPDQVAPLRSLTCVPKTGVGGRVSPGFTAEGRGGGAFNLGGTHADLAPADLDIYIAASEGFFGGEI